MKRTGALTRRTPMPRGGWMDRSPPPLGNRRDDAREPPPLRALERVPNYAGGTSGQALPKDEPVRSETYRRKVAAMPCIHCGRGAPSQCAHANTGKGMGLKVSDLDTFPLCPACHSAFDQGALFPRDERRAIEVVWIRATRAEVRMLANPGLTRLLDAAA
jgi:hypothetical protein